MNGLGDTMNLFHDGSLGSLLENSAYLEIVESQRIAVEEENPSGMSYSMLNEEDRSNSSSGLVILDLPLHEDSHKLELTDHQYDFGISARSPEQPIPMEMDHSQQSLCERIKVTEEHVVSSSSGRNGLIHGWGRRQSRRGHGGIRSKGRERSGSGHSDNGRGRGKNKSTGLGLERPKNCSPIDESLNVKNVRLGRGRGRPMKHYALDAFASVEINGVPIPISPDQLKIKPKQKKARKTATPEEHKTPEYLESRRKNTESARRCRDAKKIADDGVKKRLLYLETNFSNILDQKCYKKKYEKKVTQMKKLKQEMTKANKRIQELEDMSKIKYQ